MRRGGKRMVPYIVAAALAALAVIFAKTPRRIPRRREGPGTSRRRA